jgi:hypothetical protein
MHVSETTHSRRAVMEPLYAVVSVRTSGDYKREFIREFERFYRERSSDMSRNS